MQGPGYDVCGNTTSSHIVPGGLEYQPIKITGSWGYIYISKVPLFCLYLSWIYRKVKLEINKDTEYNLKHLTTICISCIMYGDAIYM